MAGSSESSREDRRAFLKVAATAVIAGVIAGVGGYFSGLAAAPAVRTITITERETVTKTVTTTTTITATPKPLPNTVIIAWNAEITSMDPHKYHRPIYVESPWDSIYDRYLNQNRQLKYSGGIIERWEYVDEEMKVLDLYVRRDVKCHDGTSIDADDIIFSLKRNAQSGMAYAGVYGIFEKLEKKGNYVVRAHQKFFYPVMIAWLGFLASFLVPKEPFEKAGEEAFFKHPIATGPYKFVEWVPGSYLKLEVFEDHWAGAPPIKNVIFKETLDPGVRVAELEAGTSDYTTEIPVKEWPRLSGLPHLKGLKNPVTDVIKLFILPYYEEFADEKVRLALHHAIDKEKITRDVLLGFGIPISTTEAPDYWAFPKDYVFPYDLEKAKRLMEQAGYGPEKRLKITVQTTHGWIARDREVIEACVDMWKKIYVDATIEIYTVPMYFDYRKTGRLAHLALYAWSNATGDPINSVYYSMAPKSPFSYWVGLKTAKKTDYTGLMEELDGVMAPVIGEKDFDKRMKAGMEAAIYCTEHGLVIPLYQRVQPIIMHKNLDYEPWPQGWTRTKDMRWVGPK
ncbi:TPA: hypothetical protein EYP27_06425 [Candidatus Bathyarchaeota archaeon]|nr:hypothetical protein [Candidatus Bathyarchaeota archaeon]